jgi:hypothetical protein
MNKGGQKCNIKMEETKKWISLWANAHKLGAKWDGED